MARKASARGEKRGIGDQAVVARTGKTWRQRFGLLDRAGARNKSHQGIVALIAARYAVSPWWQQMITVTYEQGRGLRERHETAHGHQLSVSRTLALSASRLFEAWITPRARRLWMPDAKLVLGKTVRRKTIHAKWVSRGVSELEVRLTTRARGRTQITVQHSRLTTLSSAARMKEYWAGSLAALVRALETGAL
ncbi:MAG: hypothetical protein ABSF61_00475 [Anaerolineales bacterium]|jgi:uncharacterized protein YndB with AHSA1/START domain